MNRSECVNSLIGIMVLCGVATAATAEEDSSKVNLKTEKVIVFKDGYSMFVHAGEAKCDDKGEIHIDEVPDAAVLGSFWATSDDGPPISMKAGFESITNKIERSAACTRQIEVLIENKGKECTVEVNNKTYTGNIREVLTKEGKRVLQPVEYAAFHLDTVYSSRRPLSSPAVSLVEQQGTHFVLTTEKGDVLLPVNSIRTLTIKDMTITRNDVVTEIVKKKRLTLRFDKPGKKKKITLIYFRPGIRWIPSYRIGLTEDKKKMANISLQAELLNEAEDLNDVPVDIVVGVPNFRFRNVVSPMVLEKVLRNTLRQAAPQIMDGQAFSNAMFTQRAGEYRGNTRNHAGAGGGSIELPAELSGTGTHDLFVYSLPKLTLKTGERMAVHIFEAKVPYRDVYTWEVTLKRHDIATAPSGSGITSPLALSKNEVWHQIELENTTKVPWTTGAAMMMQGNQPLAQELMTYTSPGGIVRVPITVSVDTRGTATENEVGRALKALTWERHTYAKITNEAKLLLANRKKDALDFEITFRFGGKVENVSDDGKSVVGPYNAADWQNYRGSSAVNNSSVVTWKTTIEPGETFEPRVKYHYYARH
jgi:hypothetical protein